MRPPSGRSSQIAEAAPQLAATVRRYLTQVATFLAPRSVDVADAALRQLSRWILACTGIEAGCAPPSPDQPHLDFQPSPPGASLPARSDLARPRRYRRPHHRENRPASAPGTHRQQQIKIETGSRDTTHGRHERRRLALLIGTQPHTIGRRRSGRIWRLFTACSRYQTRRSDTRTPCLSGRER